MTKCLMTVLAALTLVGCATKSEMPDHVYRQLGAFASQAQRCFDDEMISPSELAAAKQVVSYATGTWNFNSAKLSDAYNDSFPTFTSKSACRNFQADLLTKQSEIDRRERNNAQAASELREMGRQLGNIAPKSTYCHRIGTMVNCF